MIIKKEINPTNEVFSYEVQPELAVNRNENSQFHLPFSNEEKEKLLNLYLEKNKVNAFNGKSIRLDNIYNSNHSTTLEISKVEFYDFLSTTMLFSQKTALLEYCEANQKTEEKRIIEEFSNTLTSKLSNASFENVIKIQELSNIIAVSILVEDIKGEVLLIQRTNKVAVSSGIFSVTATGSLDEQDYHAENPFITCAKRELKEELNLHADAIFFDELVMSQYKLQPVALLSTKLNTSWKSLVQSMKSAKDFHKENQHIYVVPISVLSQFLYTEKFTDAAAYQIYKKVKEKEGKIEEWKEDFNKSNYLL